MSNLEKYNSVFIETLDVGELILKDLKYQDVESWDSVGHMSLIAVIEDTFEIELETDDIIEFSSYEIGKEILQKYNIEF